MRISTNSIYEAGAASIVQQQAELAKVGQQLSTGQRFLTAADDPEAAAKAVALSAAKAQNDQLAANQATAQNALSQSETVLGSLVNTWQNVRDLLTSAGNASLTDQDRKNIAQQLSANRATILGLVNTRDASGNYLFAGYADASAPFVDGPSGVAYVGDAGAKGIRVASGRTMTINESGADLMGGVPSGNGAFATSAAAGNAGSASIDAGGGANATALDGKTYQVVFHVSGGTTTYDVMDASGTAVSTGNAYTGSADVSVAGMVAGIRGAPADGDRFTLAPSSPGSAFDALDQAIKLLSTPVAGAAGRAALTRGLAAATSQTTAAFNHAVDAQSRAGALLAELDTIGQTTTALGQQYASQLSQVRDVDYAAASSEFAQRQVALQASEQAYGKLFTSKTLFDFI